MVRLILLSSILFAFCVHCLTPHVEPAMKEMMGMRECLPSNVVYAIGLWLSEVREHSHHRYLEIAGLREISIYLDSRAPLCHAMEMALRRMLRLHEVELSKRESASIAILRNDGWRETTLRLKNAIKPLKIQCPREFSVSPREKQIVHCMRTIEKKGTAKLMVYYLGGTVG